MSFFDTLQQMGLFKGGQQPAQPQQNPYGLDQQAMRQVGWQTLGNIGSQIMALSQQMTPAQRAAMMARADFTGGAQQNLFNAAQMKLLQDKRQQAAQEDERAKATQDYLAQTLQAMPDGPAKQKATIYYRMGDYAKAAEAATAMASNEPPTMKTVRVGDRDVTYQWDPRSNQWVKFGEGVAFKPTPDTVVNNNMGGANKFDEKVQTLLGEAYGEQAKLGATAYDTKLAVQQLRTLLQDNGGALDGFATIAASYLPPELLPEGANDLVAADAIIAGLIPKQRVPGSGSTSDFDARQFQRSLPSIWNKPGANEIILDTLEAYSDYKIAVADIIGGITSDPNIQDKQAAIRTAIKQLPDPFENWKNMRGILQKGGVSQQTAPGKGDGMSEELEKALEQY